MEKKTRFERELTERSVNDTMGLVISTLRMKNDEKKKTSPELYNLLI